MYQGQSFLTHSSGLQNAQPQRYTILSRTEEVAYGQRLDKLQERMVMNLLAPAYFPYLAMLAPGADGFVAKLKKKAAKDPNLLLPPKNKKIAQLFLKKIWPSKLAWKCCAEKMARDNGAKDLAIAADIKDCLQHMSSIHHVLLSSVFRAATAIAKRGAMANQTSVQPQEDFANSAYMGAMEGIERWRHARGPLPNYVLDFVTNHVRLCGTEGGHEIRIRGGLIADASRVFNHALVKENKGTPEIAWTMACEDMGLGKRKTKTIIAAMQVICAAKDSLESPVSSENDKKKGEYLAGDVGHPPQRHLEHKEMRGIVPSFLLLLDEKEQDVVRRRLGLGLGPDLRDEEEASLQCVADIYCVSRERVRQIEEMALLKLFVMDENWVGLSEQHRPIARTLREYRESRLG